MVSSSAGATNWQLYDFSGCDPPHLGTPSHSGRIEPLAANSCARHWGMTPLEKRKLGRQAARPDAEILGDSRAEIDAESGRVAIGVPTGAASPCEGIGKLDQRGIKSVAAWQRQRGGRRVFRRVWRIQAGRRGRKGITATVFLLLSSKHCGAGNRKFLIGGLPRSTGGEKQPACRHVHG